MPELRQEYLDILEKREWSVSSYIEYTAPLDPQQVSDYELVLAPEEDGHE